MSNVLCNGKNLADKTEVLPLGVDSATGGLLVMETNHISIHAGEAFVLSGEYSTLAAGATLYMLMDSSAAAAVHFTQFAILSTGGPIEIGLYEAPTVTGNGTEVTAINKNREIATEPASITYIGSTVTADGTLLLDETILATGTGSNTIGLIQSASEEWIFDTSKLYLWKIINNDNGAVDLHFTFYWHEHVPGQQ